jgi:transcriptional regulator with XRE-family HTH domain
MTSLSERLKFARERAGLKQTELAKLAGCTQATISKIERGTVFASAALPSLAHALGCNAYWLEQGLEDPSWVSHEKRTVMMPAGETATNLSPLAYKLGQEFDLIAPSLQARAAHEILGLILGFQDESKTPSSSAPSK